MKRILLLLALATVGTAAGVSAAEAGIVGNEWVSYAYSGFVPCANDGAGEYVTGTIDVHNLATSTVNGNVDNWQFHFQPHGSLVGRITGDSYQLTGATQGSYHESLPSGDSTLTYVNRYQLIGRGAGNNLVVRETAHVTIHGDEAVVQHDDFSVECT